MLPWKVYIFRTNCNTRHFDLFLCTARKKCWTAVEASAIMCIWWDVTLGINQGTEYSYFVHFKSIQTLKHKCVHWRSPDSSSRPWLIAKRERS